MAEASKDVQFVDGDRFKCKAVENKCGQGTEIVAGQLDVGMMDENRYGGVNNNPTVHRPVWDIRHCIFLEMDGDLLVEVFRMNAEQLVEPMKQ